jgi:undecaprenyl diphosphate synthase
LGQQRGLPRIEGHRHGVETVRAIIDGTRELGIRYLTLYTFSIENQQRRQEEVGALMSLLEYFLKRETATLVKNRVRLLTIGRTAELPAVARASCPEVWVKPSDTGKMPMPLAPPSIGRCAPMRGNGGISLAEVRLISFSSNRCRPHPAVSF